MDTVAPVARPVMLQRWDALTYVHWRYPVADVQRLLPPGLTVDTFQGEAWVGLVPFVMRGVRIPGLPAVPWVTTFPETNIRTYVRGPDGGSGVWFASLDIPRGLAVAVARTAYRLPYMWSAMSVQRSGDRIRYRSRRRWPRSATGRAASDVTVAIGAALSPGEVTPLDAFLTARWGLYTAWGGRLTFAPVQHEAWPLHTATLTGLDQHLTAAAGLPAPRGAPLVRYSPGVDVRIGAPRSVRRVRSDGFGP